MLSDFQPDHPKWPGKVKGWPVPSLAYQRERWDLYIDHEQGGVKFYKKMLARLASAPEEAAKDAWEGSLRYDRKSLTGYSGPHDPKYRKVLKLEFEEGLERSRRQLQQLQEKRP